VLCYSSMGM